MSEKDKDGRKKVSALRHSIDACVDPQVMYRKWRGDSCLQKGLCCFLSVSSSAILETAQEI